MIENIRKYTGLMIVVLVLLFVGLVFLGDGVKNSFGSKPVMEVAGQSISQKEYQRNMAVLDLPSALSFTPLSRDTRVLASHYLGDAIIEDTQYSAPGSIIAFMSRFLQGDSADSGRFVANRLNVQKAGIEYGVTPSNDEVESFVENVLFADREGNYDQEAYTEFIKNRVTGLGGTKGFNEYIRDLLTSQNLAKLLGGGIAPEMETIRSLYNTEKQVITAEQVTLEAAVYEGKITPTEEQLKEFYEENKANYNSDELRSVSYTLIAPDWEKTLDTVTREKAAAALLAADAKKKAEQEAKEANDAIKPAPTEKPAPADKPASSEEPATTEAPKPDEGTPAPTPEKTDPVDTGSQGDPGEPGEPAAAPEKPAEPAVVPAAQPVPTNKPVLVEPNIVRPSVPPPGLPNAPVVKPAPLVKPAPPKSAPPKSAKDQLNGAEKKTAVDALNLPVTKLFQDLADNLGKDFEDLTAKAGYKVIPTELFAKDSPPQELAKGIQNNSIGSLANAVFLLPPTGDPDEKLSDPFQTSEGWYIIRLDDVQESVPLSFEEARVKVTVDLKKKLAREQMIEEATALREKIAEAVKAGKSFEEAAEEAGQKIEKFSNLVAGQSFQGRFFGNPAFEPAKFTNPGELTPLTFDPSEEEASRALIIYVDKREITKDEQYNTQLENAFNNLTQQSRLIAFENWLNDRYNESEVVPPVTGEQQP